jgi:hypothetical protein
VFLLGLLCGVPLVAALILLAVKDNGARKIIVKGAALATMVLALASAWIFYQEPVFTFKLPGFYGEVVLAADVCVCLFILYLTIKSGRPLIGFLALLQTGLMLWMEKTTGSTLQVTNDHDHHHRCHRQPDYGLCSWLYGRFSAFG